MFNFSQTIEKVRKELKEISEERTIVIMVDELDRCVPQYAIKVLERLHHILPDSVNAIMELKFVDYNACCGFYKQISMVSGRRNYIWNGFQEGISGMQQLDSELDELLLKQYELNI